MPTHVGRPTYNTGSGFFTRGGQIYDANGSAFTIRGFNHTTWWGSAKDEINAIGQFKKTGANAVRVVFGSDFGPSQTPAQRKLIVEKFIAQGIVPIVEDGTATGKKDAASLRKIVDRWLQPGNVAWLKKYEKQVILNIANEWGPDSTVWRDEYKKAITRVRNAGVKNMLVIDSGDGPGPGQSAHTIEKWGQALIDHDPQHNVALSVHMYNCWRTEDRRSDVGMSHPAIGNPWDIATELKRMKGRRLPVIVGEFSSDKYSVVKYKTARALQIFSELGIGWLAWSWNANAVSSMNMAKGWRYSSDADLKDFGKLVIKGAYGLKATAKAATIFQAKSPIPPPRPTPTPPTPPPNPKPSVSNAKKQTAFKKIVVNSSIVTIQAENFDNGGEGVAYHDAAAVNHGGRYRNTGVDIEKTRDAGGGYDLAWTRAGEWLEYTVDVARSGDFDLGFRVASLASGGKFHLAIDGKDATGTLGMIRTGSWQKWATVKKNRIHVAAGHHVFRLAMDKAGAGGWLGNFNYISIKRSA